MIDKSYMLYNCLPKVTFVKCAVACLGGFGLVGDLHRAVSVYCSMLRVSGFSGYHGVCELFQALYHVYVVDSV